ncbi:hypothetical protein HK405_004212 [Cladochytrium tenue]|nr:hypothetical protein HK405_004212 [Cladochytrium tenue]
MALLRRKLHGWLIAKTRDLGLLKLLKELNYSGLVDRTTASNADQRKPRRGSAVPTPGAASRCVSPVPIHQRAVQAGKHFRRTVMGLAALDSGRFHAVRASVRIVLEEVSVEAVMAVQLKTFWVTLPTPTTAR